MLFKCLSYFWITLEMPLINCEVNLTLIWSENCVIVNSVDAETLAITDTKFHVLVVPLLAKDDSK